MSVRSRSDWSEIVFQNLTTKIYPFLSHEVSIFMFVENFPFKSTNILRDVENIEFWNREFPKLSKMTSEMNFDREMDPIPKIDRMSVTKYDIQAKIFPMMCLVENKERFEKNWPRNLVEIIP